MTTLENRPNTALLVVDVQNGVVAEAHERALVIANVGSLVEQARREKAPVVWVRHSDEQLAEGSDEWQIVGELVPGNGEPIVEKKYGDSFEDTALEAVLSDSKVGRLVVVGAQTDACIRSTLHGALVRGYDATLVSDAHTTEDQSAWGAHLNTPAVWIAVVEDFAATADSSPATRLFSGNASPWREAVVVLVRDRQCVDI